MSRKTKSRKIGAFSGEEIVSRNRTSQDIEGRRLKKSRKHKGNKTGSRYSTDAKQNQAKENLNLDPRLGSKKKISLAIGPKKPKDIDFEAVEARLAILENDEKLNALIDRIEAGDKLGEGLQEYVDVKLEEIKELMEDLGLLDE